MARTIPILLLKNDRLVKTKNFRSPTYIGCPQNAVRLFTELGADELIVLGIDRNANQRYIRTGFLSGLACEAQMPLVYGGGIKSLDDAKLVFDSGFERVAVNQVLFNNPCLISQIADIYGSQAVTVSIDYRNIRGTQMVFTEYGTKATGETLKSKALEAVKYGAGELLITNINSEGSWNGYDTDTASSISNSCTIPIVFNGGCRSISDIREMHTINDTSAGIGSMAVFYGKSQGVLLNYPSVYEMLT